MSLNITLEVHKCCEKDNCIIIMFIAFLFCGQYRFVSFFPFVHPLFGPDYVQLFFLDCTLSFFPFYSHVHCPAPLPLFFLSSPHCVPLFPLPSPHLHPFVMGPSAGVVAVPPQYVQHAVPTPRPTRLWDPPHIPSTFTFSFSSTGFLEVTWD